MVDAVRETELDKFSNYMSGSMGNDRSGQEIMKAFGTSQYDHKINEDIYWYLNTTGQHDNSQALDYRVYGGPGAGWKALEAPKYDLSIEGGPAFELQRYQALEQTASIRARMMQKFEYRFFENTKLFQSTEYLGDPAADSQYLLTARFGAQTGLTKLMSLRFSFDNQYNAAPPLGTKNNDLSATTAIIFSY